MQKLHWFPNKQNTYDQQFHLSQIKQDCYDMLVRCRRGEDQGYDLVVEGLHDLNFDDFSCEEYVAKLVILIDRIIKLDDLEFDSKKLYQFRNDLQQ